MGTHSEFGQSNATRPTVQSKKKKHSIWSRQYWRNLRRDLDLFSISLPGLLFIFVFSYLPMFGVILAFKKFRYDLGIWGSEWVGFQNFEFFFRSDVAIRTIRNTILYSFGFWVTVTIGALVMAIFLNELTRRWVKTHQTILFLPHFISAVIIAYLVEAFIHHDYGFLNTILENAGGEKISWYFEWEYWPAILLTVNLWKHIGFSTLIYYAGIMGIDPHLYEAAKMDGANRWQTAMKITIPSLMPLVIILFFMSLGNIFQADFGLFYFVPKDSVFLYPTTDVINTFVYRALTQLGDIGMSAAVGFFQSVVGLFMVVMANYIIRKINSENALW